MIKINRRIKCQAKLIMRCKRKKIFLSWNTHGTDNNKIYKLIRVQKTFQGKYPMASSSPTAHRDGNTPGHSSYNPVAETLQVS